MTKQAVVRAAWSLALAVAFAAASASAASAGDKHNNKDHNNHHNNNHHNGSFNSQQMFDNLQYFDNHTHKVGKSSQRFHQPKNVKPYLNPNGGSDHPPLAGGWWLGVSTQDYGHGPEVQFVSHGSPAARVGIEQGDIIHEVDGIRVATRWDLSQAIRYSDGYVRLLIEDVRTGQFVYRMVRLTQRNAYPY